MKYFSSCGNYRIFFSILTIASDFHFVKYRKYQHITQFICLFLSNITIYFEIYFIFSETIIGIFSFTISNLIFFPFFLHYTLCKNHFIACYNFYALFLENLLKHLDNKKKNFILL